MVQNQKKYESEDHVFVWTGLEKELAVDNVEVMYKCGCKLSLFGPESINRICPKHFEGIRKIVRTTEFI